MKKQKFISLLCVGSMLAAQSAAFATVYDADQKKDLDFGDLFLNRVYKFADVGSNLLDLDFATIFGTEDPVVTYNVSVGNVVGGTVELSDSGDVEEGTTVTVTATAHDGYELENILVNGQAIAEDEFEVTDVTVVTATFKKVSYAITAPAEVKGLPGESEWGEELEFTVEVADDKEIVSVTVNGEEKTAVDGKYSFEMPKGDVEIVVNTQDKVVVPEEPTDTEEVYTGENVKTFKFEDIFGEEEPPVVVEKFNVSVGEVSNGTVTLDVEGEVEKDTVVTITATAAEGYELDKILVNGEAIEGTTFVVTEDAVVTATFKELPPVIVEYNVTIGDIENGTVTLDKSGKVAENETVTITATAATGYKLESILVNGVAIEGTTFVVTEDAVVTATFSEIKKYNITLAPYENGTVVLSIHGMQEEGKTVAVAPYANDGYEVDQVLVNGKPIEMNMYGGYSFILTEDSEVTVTFKAIVVEPTDTEEVYTGENVKTFKFEDIFGEEEPPVVVEKFNVSVGEVSNGTVTLDVEGEVEKDTVVTITATAAEGYELDKILVNGEAIEGNTFVVTEDAEVTATFTEIVEEPTDTEPVYDGEYVKTFKFEDIFSADAPPVVTDKYTVSVGTVENGTVVLDVDGEVEEGTTVTITATANEGYELDKILVNGEAIEGNTFVVTEDAVVTATFKELPPVIVYYNVSVGAVENGTVTLDKSGKVAENETVTITATAAEGYELDKILVNGVAIEGTTFVVTEDAEVTATFKELPPVIVYYNVSVGTVENGTVTLDKSGEVEEGTTVTITATANEGYELDKILVNGDAIEGNTFVVDKDAVVTATFKELPPEVQKFNVTIGDVENGTVTLDKKGQVAEGSTVTVTAKASKGYELDKILVNGEEIEGNTFVVTGDAEVTAVFVEKAEYDVDFASMKNGDAEFTVNGDESDTAKEGDTIKITTSPDKNYTLKKITYTYTTEDGDKKTVTVKDKRFTMPASDVTITVTFAKKSTGGGGGGSSSSGGGIINTPTTPDTPDTPDTPVTPVTPSEPETAFDDVTANDWFNEAVEYVADKGVMTGVADREFNPNGVVTRAMVVTTLQRIEAPDYAGTTTPFADVAEDAWYAKSVAWAYENGIVKGISDTEYAPDALVTREQLAAILDRYVDAYHKDIDATADITSYVDSAEISDWAYESVASAVGMGIITGTDANEINPLGNATRAEYATMLSRILKKLGE